MAELISRRYAEALFEIAAEKNSVDKFYDDVALIYESIKDDKEFLTILKHPQISGEEKLDMLTAAFKGRVDDDILGLFSVAVSKNREAQIPDMLEVFIEKVRSCKGMASAELISAKPLTAPQIKSIQQKLEQTSKKQVDLKYSIDPSLIGGLRIKMCGMLIDNTVKRRLDEITSRLMETRV
ncbi:MAG: ATP synthase F1 subunit delta [Firmicutes bacterium]|nr:ATP synthase F1 subunit delta [Bacillota bacterium]